MPVNPKFQSHGCICAACENARRDSKRLQALEDEIAKNGGIVLHTGDFGGKSKYAGLGFGPTLGRDLRGALDACFRFPWSRL